MRSTSGLGFASTDYLLFMFMANDLVGEELASRKACENRLSEFLVNIPSGHLLLAICV